MSELYLHPNQVRDFIKKAEDEDEVIIIRCIRKTAASKAGGPDKGDLYDLHCTKKPQYNKKTGEDRDATDAMYGVLTVYVTNRRSEAGELGAWRRVNIEQVKKVIYKSKEYEVRES